MRYLILILSLFFCSLLTAQKEQLQYDTSTVKLRSVNISTYKYQRDFQYKNHKAPTESLWDRFWNWFWETIDRIRETKSGRLILDWSVIISGVAAILFFIWKVVGMNASGVFGRSESLINYSIGKDDINAIDFNAAIEESISKLNYVMAVRLLYLQSLKILSDANIIEWKINKTNADYITELNKYSYQSGFRYLTGVFDYVWYGNKIIDRTEFDQVHQSFKQFQQAIISEKL